MGKLPIYEMPPTFHSTLVAGQSWKVGTLQNFLESCMSLEKDPDALAEIESMLYRQEKGRHDYTMNSLHKKKTRMEMKMNVQIGDYDVDSVILDLGSDVNILKNKTWERMGKP